MVRLCTPQKNTDNAKSQPSLQDELTKALDTLHDLFDDIGLTSSAREAREASVYSALNVALREQLDLINDEKEHITEQCQELIASIKQMEQSLAENKSRRRNSNDDRITTPLTKCLRELKEEHDVIKKRHTERYDSVKKLAQELEKFGSRLEPSALQISLPLAINDPALSASLDLSESYHERLEAESNRVYQEFTRRVSTVKAIAKDIINLYAELGIPITQVDQPIIDFGTAEPERLGLKREDIEQLRGKKEKLLDEKEKRQEQVEDLKNEIEELWEKLGIEIHEQRTFLAEHRGCDLKTIRELEKELDRMLELKQDHLHIFVEDAREALAGLWEKLYFSEQEILHFSPARSEAMSDALLVAHEMEIQRLRDLLDERSPIISLIDKHRSLINDRESLARSANDSSRLISRGGTGNRDPTRLLREEKTRKRITKELPKIELDLKRILEQWEDEYGETFLVKGEDYLQTLLSTNNSRAGANSRQGSATTPIGRARANTASSATGPTRPLSRGPVSKPVPRPKTPSAPQLRSKTPTERSTTSMSSGTVSKPGVRSLVMAGARETAAPQRSGARTPGPSNRTAPSGNSTGTSFNRSQSKGPPRTPLPPPSVVGPQSLTQTIGRFATSRRKAVPLSNIMGPLKMQPLPRLGSKDSHPVQGRGRARSEISIRSVSPEERPYEAEEDPRAGGQYSQFRNSAPYPSPSSREVSEDSSNASTRSRQFSLTSSTTLMSGSGSENWETFGAESEYGDEHEERVDPKEAYYRNKIGGYGEQKGGGGGGIVMVRPADGEEEWMSEGY